MKNLMKNAVKKISIMMKKIIESTVGNVVSMTKVLSPVAATFQILDVDSMLSNFTASELKDAELIQLKDGFLKEYSIVINGVDKNHSLPNGMGREFSITFNIKSVFNKERLGASLEGATGFGFESPSEKFTVVTVTNARGKNVVARTLPLSVKREYESMTLFDLGDCWCKNAKYVNIPGGLVLQ